jgi:hypothetical protein
MQTMERPDGSLFQELFTDKQVKDGTVARRRKLLEKAGMTFKRLERVDTSRYLPHQGEREIARRLRQMARRETA